MITRAAQTRSSAAIVADTIERRGLLEAGDRVLVALSGGSDSCALAVILQRLGYHLVLGHVDHGLRSSSAAEADRCAEIAARMRLPFEAASVRVRPPREAEARRVRYAALEAMADRVAAQKIATGHTLDDQAETVLMRLRRGGHAVGIPPRRGRIVRPLLDLRRSDTERVCRAEGIDYVRDPSNLDDRMTRNLIRNRVLPRFEDEMVVRLARMADAGEREVSEVRREVDRLAATIVGSSEGVATLDREALLELPPARAAALLRAAIQEAVSGEVTSRLVSDVLAKVVPETGARLDLPGGRAVWAEPRHLVVGMLPTGAAPPEFEVKVPGRTPSLEWGIEVTSEEVAPELGRARGPNEAVFDAAALEAPLTIRPRVPGDRFHPLGMTGSKKLQDFLVDLKVPRRERDRIPILTSAGRIAWVVGYRIDDRFKLTPSTRRAVRIGVAAIQSRAPD